MKNYFKTILWTTAVSWACFGATIASAALTIDSVNMDPMGLSPYLSVNDSILIAVTLTDPSLSSDVNIKESLLAANPPTLNFYLQNKDNPAKTVVKAPYAGFCLSSIDDPNAIDTIYFAYKPAPTDYKRGASIPTGTWILGNRNIITGSTITNLNGGAALSLSGQYSLAVAANVNTGLVSQALEVNMYKVESPNSALGVSVDAGSSIQVVVTRAAGAFGNTNELKLVAQSNNGAFATVAPSAQTITSSQSSCIFTITGVAPGATSITVYSELHSTETVTIPVTVNLSAAAKVVTITPPSLVCAEDASGGKQLIRVSLGAASPSAVNLDITGYLPGKVIGDASVVIQANQTQGSFYLSTPDGDANPILTISDPAHNYDTAYMSISVTNVAPTIITPPDGDTQTTIVGDVFSISAGVIDPAKTNDTITCTWDFGDGTGTTTGTTTSHIYTKAGTYTVMLTARDEDGGESIRTITVVVEVGSLLVLKAPSIYKNLDGIGSGTFVFLNPASTIYDPTGNRFPEGFGVNVRAVPDPGSYRFTWIADEGIADILKAMPASSDAELSAVINMTAESLEVIYLFSKEYYTGIDGFGDIDADGLSDKWEAKWFEDGGSTSDQLGQTPCTQSTGDYGDNGNPDGDFLPGAGLHSQAFAGVNYMVYDYPIAMHKDTSGVQQGYLPDATHPFNNFIEYRGLEEDRGAGFIRYALEFPKVNSAGRGNDPATDPTKTDTDEDGMEDGWEYYFWTTIMYEVNADKNWRAFDPLFNFYDGANSAAVGLPILQRGPFARLIETNMLADVGAYIGGTVTNLIIKPTSFTVKFDDGTTYTDNGKGRLIRNNQLLMTVDYTSGVWTAYSPITASVGADYVVSYDLLDGPYSKAALLAAFDPAIKGVSTSDVDQDGLYDTEEFALGTNPIHWDTDADGMPDGWEVERGLDPLDNVGVNGAAGNLDQDYMVPDHCLTYIETFLTQAEWNGQAAFGFNPGEAWTGPVPPHMALSNLDEFRVAEYYVQTLDEIGNSPVPFVDSLAWLFWTTDPCDNDTDVDGMPDGWELYVGLPPMLRGAAAPAFDVQLGDIVGMGTDFDADGLDVLGEFQNTTITALRSANETVTSGGVTATIRAFAFSRTDWTNKTRPTDPWNSDTDGDGLMDGGSTLLGPGEYIEPAAADLNDDDNTLVNLNPTSVDTDHDWLPDSWEYYNGLQTTNSANRDYKTDTGTFGDPDGDGLPNYQEYLTGCNYGWRYDKCYNPTNQTLWKPDWAVPGSEGESYATDPYSLAFRAFDSGDFMLPFPSPVSLQANFEVLERVESLFGITVNPPADSLYGYTYLELLQRTIIVIQNPQFPMLMLTDPAAYVAMLTFEQQLHIVDFRYGLNPLSWDSAVWAVPLIIPYYYLNSQVDGLYATSNPRNPDSDYDGMEDYWEIYHGLNPIYGGDLSSTDEMGGSIQANLSQSIGYYMGLFPVFGPISREGKNEYRDYQTFAKWRPNYAAEPTGSKGDPIYDKYLNAYWNTWRPYDLVNNPCLSGCPYGDPDEDGLNSREEAYNLFAADVLSHTDPSPYWLTDISYNNFDGAASHVNNYYVSGSLNSIWWWGYADEGLKTLDSAPSYLFDYEVNEGYDTDNNNISDREELTTTDLRGVTDPLDFDSPRSRKAMYLNGNAACRTRNPYFHDKWALTSYTVEMWFRSETPVGGGVQTLIERPVVAPVDWKNVDEGFAIRRTFRLSITNDGRLRGEFQNDALATFSAETTASNGRISPNVWYHVAVTMDSQANFYSIYLNGSEIQSIACNIKPCTGYFAGSQIADYDPRVSSAVGIELLDTYAMSPAPIVVGASDNMPTGVVGENDPILSTFFKGWVDEIRIWDRVRSQSEIQTDMYKRYDKEKVESVNHARFVWDEENAISATALSDFPQKLLYHYGFDNLPDVIPAASRDPGALIPGSDTDDLPYGFDQLSVRPSVTDYPGIPWWYASSVRSTVYNRDFAYVPFIENTAAHARQYPPLDMASVLPVYDQNYEILGYRWRTSLDWLVALEEITGMNPIDISASYDIPASLIPNSSNPYGFTYHTALGRLTEINPMTFSGEIGLLSRYETLPIYTDMVPLLDAVADIDVDMWDGLGEGFNSAAIDSDGDGLPDWWEVANGLDPFVGDGENGAYGDPDGDGLDNYSEYQAGTSPYSIDTNGDGYSDYYSRDNNKSLTYGELYDDGDAMPNDWEVEYGLNPNRYDSMDDYDNDGWNNYEEYMAGTIPNSAYSYPQPSTEFKFNYDGTATNFQSMIVYTYSENTAGTNMGGNYDGRLSTHSNVGGDGGILGSTTYTSGGYTYHLSSLYYGKIVPGTLVLTVNVFQNGSNTVETFTMGPFNEEMGSYTSADNLGMIDLYYETGLMIVYGKYVGCYYSASYQHGWAFPVTVRNPIVAAGTHICSGYNRFFGFLDTDSSGEYTLGEPCGLSISRPTLVSWDSVSAEIACTDFLVGYPRLAWPAGTNSTTDHVTVTIQSAGNILANIDVEKPRNFLHEGDLLIKGIKGLPFGAATTATFTYFVFDGTDQLATGSFSYNLGTTATRRAMKAVYPIQLEKVYGSLVEFKWEMDYRNEGVAIVIKGLDDGKTYYNDTNALPVRHGKILDESYFFTTTPQTLNGKAYFSLPPGRYTYTLTEYVNSTGVTKKSVTERFQVVTDETLAQEIYSISGNISYFGKAETAATNVVLHTFTGAEASFSGAVPGTNTLSAGTISFQVVNGTNVVESLSDSNADGALLSDSGTNSFLSGRVYYDTRAYYVQFANTIPANYKLRIAYKYLRKPIVVEAFKLNDDSLNCYAVSGTPVARTIKYGKGAYSLQGLAAGKYAVRAYLDSNTNTVLDAWESYGIAVNGASQGPIAYTSYEPIVVPTSQTGKNIIINDKDTDNDLLPDAWEYQHYTNILLKSGYDQVEPDLYLWEEYADGALDSDPTRIDTDGDGLSDAVELHLTGTDTHEIDTDNDGVNDLEEFLSGSNPLKGSEATSYKTLGLEFDAADHPFVKCNYPDLVRGIVISYILKYKSDLNSNVWTPVYEVTVSAPDVTSGKLKAGSTTMTPSVDSINWKNGFFKVDVQVDYGTWNIN